MLSCCCEGNTHLHIHAKSHWLCAVTHLLQAGIAYYPNSPELLVLHAVVLLELKHDGPTARSNLAVSLAADLRMALRIWHRAWQEVNVCEYYSMLSCFWS